MKIRHDQDRMRYKWYDAEISTDKIQSRRNKGMVVRGIIRHNEGVIIKWRHNET